MRVWRWFTRRAPIVASTGHLLRDLTPATIQAWVDGLPTPDTAHRCRRLLHICLEDAVRLNLLALNPVDRVTTPQKGASTATAWTREEARRFLTTAALHSYHPYWPLALRLGLRPSELLGLRWGAVNFDAGTLTVSEGRATVANTSFEGAPKSDSGYRTLDLPSDLITLLRAHQAKQKVRQSDPDTLWHDNNLVCAAERGQPIGYRNLTRAFKCLCAVAKVRSIRLYDLRHTAISVMAASGADIKAISEVAGHANVLVTRTIYQHINRNQRAAALAALTEALSAPTAEAVLDIS